MNRTEWCTNYVIAAKTKYVYENCSSKTEINRRQKCSLYSPFFSLFFLVANININTNEMYVFTPYTPRLTCQNVKGKLRTKRRKMNEK